MVAVGISGRISSGKSTLAAEVAKRLGGEVVSFGRTIAAVAEERGLSPTRSVLQSLGSQLIQELGHEGLVRLALERASASGSTGVVVFDGVRHAAVANAIREVCGQDTLIVFVDANEHLILQRLEVKGLAVEDLARIEQDETERDVVSGALLGMADLVVTGTDFEADGAVIVEAAAALASSG